MNKIRPPLSEGQCLCNSIDPTFRPISVNHMCVSFHAATVGEKIIFPNCEVKESIKMMGQFLLNGGYSQIWGEWEDPLFFFLIPEFFILLIKIT